MTTPSQPATPSVVTTVKITEASTSAVHQSERIERPIMSRISATMTGSRLAMSACGTSVKATLNMTLPVRCRSMSG